MPVVYEYGQFYYRKDDEKQNQSATCMHHVDASLK